MSAAHQEQQLLSAYVDGELTEREQVMVEAHLASCTTCPAVLAALRATIGDLALLGEAVPSEQDSWALRSAIAKERRLDRRGRRWYAISGGAAAAVVAVLAFALSTGGGSTTGARQRTEGAPAFLGAGGGTAGGGVELLYSDVNYTEGAAQERLLAFSSVADGAYQLDATAKGPAQESAPGAVAHNTQSAVTGFNASLDDERLAKCVAAVPRTASEPLQPRYYEAARFEGKDVFFLVFEAVEARRLELWVMLRSDCHVEFWAQTRA